MRTYITLLFLLLGVNSYCQLTMEGQAVQYGPTCDCYEITSTGGQNGSIWSPYTLDLTNSFDFTFQVYLGVNDANGADGIVFVLQADPDGIGNIGYTMGYSAPFGSPNPISAQSLAIEIDTWVSSGVVPTDITSDHVGLSDGLSNDHNLGGPYAIANIEDGAWHTMQIIWDATLQVYTLILDAVPIFAYAGDIVTNSFAGNPIVYFGFTSSTGGSFNEHRVCAYRTVTPTADQTSVCPGTVVNFTGTATSELDNQILSYSWDFDDGSPLDATQNPSHAFTTPGVYSVALTITDLWNCPTTETVDITILPDLIINADSVDITCFGDDDGQVIANVLSGTGPYTYTWDDPGAQTTQTVTGLGPNTYTVIAVDDLGCTGTGSVVVLEPTQLVLDSAVTTNASCGVNNGSITFYANGGTPPYQYSIDGGATFQNQTLFNGLASNNYNVEVIDDNGCSITQVVTVNLDSPMVLDSLVATDVSCGPPDGTITAYVTGGTVPYLYSLDAGVTTQGGNLFNGLVAGNYAVQIEDANNCVVNGNVTINSITTLVIDNVIATDASCNGGNDGQIEIVVSGGTPAYQYSIDGGATFQGGNVFTGLSPNNYVIEVNDALACVDNSNGTVGEPTPVVIDNIVPVDATCNGASDGSFEVFASGGTPGYTYSDDAGATFQAGTVFTGLAANNYNVEVQDLNGCPVTGMTTIGEPIPVVIDSIVVTDVTCNGLMDGDATVYANGGTPGYQYSIDGGLTFQAGNFFAGLGSGPITIDVIDLNACPVADNTTINESQPIVASVGNDTTICQNGTANVCGFVTGGTAPFVYTWNGIQTTQCIDVTTPGVNSLFIMDVNGCISNTENLTVTQLPAMTLITSTDPTICAGDFTQLTAEATGGDGGPYTYIWTNNVNGTVLNGSIQDVTSDVNTTYTVTVTDGCETTPVTGTIDITTYPVPQILIGADFTQGCEPLTVNFVDNTDPTSVALTVWDMGIGNMGSGAAPSELYETPGCYDVNVEITTVNGCISDSTFTDYICVSALPIADFSYNPLDPDMFDPEVNFLNQSQFGDNYQWFFGDGNSSTNFSPSNYYPEIGNASYPATLVVSTDMGCVDTMTQIILIEEIPMYYIPNAVTPNGDSFNSTFKPIFVTGFVPTDYEFRIYDRWGVLVWESYDYTYGWDCTYLDNLVDDGVYTWQLTFLENKTDVKYREFGHVTVLK